MGKASRRQRVAKSPYVGAFKALQEVGGAPFGGTPFDPSGGKRDFLRAMAEARVIEITPEQFAALPESDAEDVLLSTAKLPFASVFVSIGEDIRLRTSKVDGGREIALATPWSETPLWGALLVEQNPDYSPVVFPFYSLNGRPLCFGCVTDRDLAVAMGASLHENFWSDVHSRLVCSPFDNDEEKEVSLGIAALRAMRVIYMLESANVDLVQNAGQPRGHQAHGVPHYDVVVRQSARRSISTSSSQPQDWSHRWEVRGHFKHYRQGPIFDANPARRIADSAGECVRIWCPPYVKGPEDKPLIPKRRVVV